MSRFLLILFFLIATFSANAASAPKTTEYQLKNGLKILVREDHRAPVVFTSVWYKVGSSYEQNGTTGISHVLEHMMFRGTKDYSAGKYIKIMNENGGEQNAMTTNDFTMYYQMIPANKLAVSFELEADRMHNLLLNESDYNKEIQVVMEERRMRFEDSPQNKTWLLLDSAANLNTPDQHPTIGWKSDLEQMQIQDLRSWYQEWYGPNNAVVVVVGDVKPQQVLQLAEQYFGHLAPLNIPPLKKFTPEPYISTKTLTLRLPAKLPVLMMAYNTPSFKTTQKAWQPYALLLLADLLGGSDSSRLSQELVRKKEMAVAVDVDYDPFRLFDSLFAIQAVPAPGHSNHELEAEIFAQIKKLQQQPVTSAELERIKSEFLASYIYDKDSIMSQGMQLGVIEILGLNWQMADILINQIKTVTPQQIQEVANTYLQLNRLTIANLIPIKNQNQKEKQ